MRKVKTSLAELPDLSGEQEAELLKLARVPDGDIDLSDASQLSDVQLASMIQGKFYRPVKQQVTARLDADVLHWLKSKGKGYQTRMNAILRAAMANDL